MSTNPSNVHLPADSDPDIEDSLIKSVQSSTRTLLSSFREKTKLLDKCSDLKLLLREGYDADIAKQAGQKFFGSKKVTFVAIDGTESQDEHLDMLIFYTGAFGYTGQLEFIEGGCSCGEVIEAKHTTSISTAIPLFEGDASRTVGRETENGIEVDAERMPSTFMQFAEYYLALKLLQDDADLNVVILDRTLAGDLGHLIWSVNELVREGRCILQGLQTEFGTVSSFDLELARILHPNNELRIPAPRSQFIKYCAIDFMLSSIRRVSADKLNYEILLDKIGANQSRKGKLVNDVTMLNQEYSFLNKEIDSLAMKPGCDRYWERVLSATLKVGQHIFETPIGAHPLIYEISKSENAKGDRNEKIKKWITSDAEVIAFCVTYSKRLGR